MLDGQGCLLPVRRLLPEDSHFWPSQHSACLAEASAETNPASDAHLETDSVEHCPRTAAPMAECKVIHSERKICRASGVADSVDSSNGWLAKENDPHCSFQQLECKSTNAGGCKGMNTKAVRVGSSRASSIKDSCENGTDDVEYVASSGMVHAKECAGGREDGGRHCEDCKRIVCFSKEEDRESSVRLKRYAGVECSSAAQQESSCLHGSEGFRGIRVNPKVSATPKGTDESFSRIRNGDSGHVMLRPSKRLTALEGRVECKGKRCGIMEASVGAVDILFDPPVGNIAGFAEAPQGSASKENTSSQQEPYLPGLDDELALRCLAFVPLSDLGQLARLSKKHRDLVKGREIFQVRRMYGTVEHLVFMYTSGPSGWTAYDVNRNVWKSVPPATVNSSFTSSDKESLSAGTHVLWFGKDLFENVYYRYDLLRNSWEKGPSMVNPRCLFASASCGDVAYVAGGFGNSDNGGNMKLLNSAEMYNASIGEWEELPPMSTPRHKCSGVFMDGKFYVIGGKDASHQPITSAEEYDPSSRTWRTIPNMYFTPTTLPRSLCEPSPPLVAVVNNQLYAVENTTNILKIYNKESNTWTNLGSLPVSAYLCNGWGVAFKGLGDKLFVMGDMQGIAACCWRPGPTVTEPVWQLLSRRERGLDSFLFNCAVMIC